MENFRKILDSMNSMAIYVIEKESHTIIYYNQKFKQLFPKAEVSLGCYELGVDICRECPVKAYEEHEKKSNVFLRESEVCNGPVEITVDEILWEDMIPAYIVTMILQMESKETEEYYVYARSADLVLDDVCEEMICCNLTDNVYKCMRWNEERQLKCIEEGSMDDILNQIIGRMTPGTGRKCRKIDTAKKMENYFRNGGGTIYREVQMMWESDEYKWTSCRVMPLRNICGEKCHAVIILRDINTRRNLQEQMRHNLAVTYKAIPGGVCTVMLDEKMTIISANAEFYKMLGKKEEDYADGYLAQIYEKDQSYVAEYINEIRKTKETIDITYRLRDGNGDIRWVQTRGVDYGEANGYPVYLILRTDVTLIIAAQKQIEDEQEKFKIYADKVIDTLSNLVEFRDVDSGEHIKRTRTLTKIILDSYNKKFPERAVSKEDGEKIVRAAALHDVGKIAISDTILNKPARLTKEEMDIMRTHTTKGYEIIKTLDLNEDAKQKKYSMDIAKYHHERWDGRGYPEQLKGEEIPLWSQIVSIVDVYDALVSPRVYKRAYSHEHALRMILGGECGVFNPILLECLQDTAELLKKEYE